MACSESETCPDASTSRSAKRLRWRWSLTSGTRSGPDGSISCLSGQQATGRNTDPATRQEIAKLLTMARSAEWTARRARAAQQQGRPQGPEGSLGKLASSNIARQASHVHTLIAGANAMLAGEDGDLGGLIAEILVSVPATSIAGGTDEIQRNIIAERVLGLPKEPRMDTGPFRDVKRN